MALVSLLVIWLLFELQQRFIAPRTARAKREREERKQARLGKRLRGAEIVDAKQLTRNLQEKEKAAQDKSRKGANR
ncbi:MAG: hypothetical protein ACYDBH_09140 [Acidobacteriaceae bacterium]